MSAVVLASAATTAVVIAVLGPPPRRPARRPDDGPRPAVGPFESLDRALAARLVRADLAALTGRPLTTWAGAGSLAILVAVLVGGAVAATLAALVALVAPIGFVVGRGDRRSLAIDRALPDALERLARGLRSGASVSSALAEVSADTPDPLGTELRAVVAANGRGLPLADALDAMAARRPTRAVRLAVAALVLGADAGGSPAGALDGVAATLRDAQAVAREVSALSSQARASVAVIAGTPPVFLVVAVALDPASGRALLTTPFGWACLVGGLALDGLGLWWMRRILGRSS